MIKKGILLFLVTISIVAKAQTIHPKAALWADSVLNSLTPDQRIAQLMVLRLSSYDFKTKTALYFDSLVKEKVKRFNVGGICLFQGSAVKLGGIVNELQAMAQTPLMVCIDGEWGVGMRLFDSVQALPRQMMLGAVEDKNIVYDYGKLVAEQCKRLGITVNYAPVVDINNNPNNPVINDRSFGEDKYKVAAYGIEYMKGMQDAGVMACAKHFPGHGDVAVDSHLDLPVINKSMEQLDSLELYPFKEIFKAGVGSVMVAHLYIPAIDSSANRATSISKKNVTGLLRNGLGYQGLTFTDAIEMQGVQKFFPGGEASVQSIIAGNDMLCLPPDVEQTIKKIKEAINKKQLSWDDINYHCKKVLLAKYQYGGEKIPAISLTNITEDLNKGVPEMKKLIAENALTVLQKKDDRFFPLTAPESNKIAYIAIGINEENLFAKKLKESYGADVYYFDYKQNNARIASLVAQLKEYNKVIIGIHNYSRKPENNFGISVPAVSLAKKLQEETNSATLVFGNPYAIKNFCGAGNLIACYEDDPIVQQAAANLLEGKFLAKGKLPVTVCDQYKFGSGISTGFFLPQKQITPSVLLTR
ncbi:MAG TPA: glycoside hydrolase family 3 N-terminal domain-containing protein [Ferruginibacter sp.]|nr:glycoside hydrolase family 3 N-terminal domain-containing protein [Ferruginibacter sp.]